MNKRLTVKPRHCSSALLRLKHPTPYNNIGMHLDLISSGRLELLILRPNLKSFQRRH